MKKKLITLLMATAVAVTSLVGCGQQATTNKSSESTAKQSGVSEEASKTSEVVEEVKNFNEEGYPIVNEEITLKIMLAIADSWNMVAPEEIPAIQRIEELTGIKTEWEVVKASDWDTKLNLMFASEEYPDLIISNFSAVNYEEYGVDQEVLIPLDDLIDKYLPSYNERIAMEDYDPTLNLVASDGQTYAVGYVNNSEYMLSKFYINQDWLDALDLPHPKGIDELTETLRAFKTKDPNDNGKADEIPLITSFDSYTGNISCFLQLFGVPFNLDNYLTINDDKKVEFLPYMDGFRECMEWMHMCYEEGLLDVEVLSQDPATQTQKFSDGLGGFGSFYLPGSEFPGGAATSYALYVPNEEARLTWMSTYAKPSAFITVANENPEATMRFIEAMLDKEVMYSLYIGEKDGSNNTSSWDYNAEGLIERTPIEGAVAPEKRWCLNVYTLFFAPGNYYAESFAMSENAMKIFEDDDVYRSTGLAQKYSHSLLKIAPLTSDQKQQIALIETEIKTAMKEHMAIFIKDGVTDANWKTFIDVLKNVKCDEYVAMYQAGIDSIQID